MSDEIGLRGGARNIRDSLSVASEAANRDTPQIYEFGPFRLEPSERKLQRGNEIVALTPKAFDTLLLLVRNSGHLMEKDELLRMLWPDSFVEEGSLSNSIFMLRKALGEDPAFIETVPRRGYRFVGAVRQLPSAARTPPEKPSQASSPGLASLPAKARWPWRSRARQGLVSIRNVLAAGLVVCAIAMSFLFYRQSIRPKAVQRITPIVTTVGAKWTPALSPDGQHLAFVWNGGSGSIFNLYVQLVGTEKSIRLTNEPSHDFNPEWSPDGRYIAFCRVLKGATGIYIIPALGGAERRVRNTLWDEESNESIWAPGHLSWSPNGKLVAFSDRASRSEVPSIFLLALDSLDVRRLTSPQRSKGDFNPEFSPDGQTLAFTRVSQGSQSIYVIPVSGGQERRLTSDNKWKMGIAWTPDSRDLIFANVDGFWKISGSGGEAEQLQFGQDGTQPSIRGNRLVYVKRTVNTNIWRRSLSSLVSAGPPDRVISSTRLESGPQFSPDGSKIAFQSTRSGGFEIWVCQGDGSSPMQLTHFYTVLTGTPRWSPDGRQIVFDSRPAGNADIFVIDFQDGPLRKLTSEPWNEEVPSWSRDGRWIYYASDRTGGWEVWKMPSTGGSAVQVTHHGGFAAFESPDGEFLYYAKGLIVPGLWRVPSHGGEEVEVISSLEADYWGYWAVVEGGIYYLNTTTTPGIVFFDFTTHRSTRLFDVDRPAGGDPGLAVSPDKRTILYENVDATDSEIILVENFQ
jgi:Tol biopolymer transport system component/DNA-binding winged helix-turn-helix (wHTH) protein